MCWFMLMPEAFIRTARFVLNIMLNEFQKAAPIVIPPLALKKPAPAVAFSYADNAAGQVVAKMGMEHAIEIARQNGVAVVGIRRMGHSGAISYFTQQAARAGLDWPLAVSVRPDGRPFWRGGDLLRHKPAGLRRPRRGRRYHHLRYGHHRPCVGKDPDARSRHESIPDSWAVDKNGAPTTDPFAVHALLPAAGPKGYGLMMMIDVLSGILLNLPFGRQVSLMYDNLSQGRELGQLHIVINPDFFSSSALFRQHISDTMRELSAITPAPGFSQVYYPGQNLDINEKNSAVNGSKSLMRFMTIWFQTLYITALMKPIPLLLNKISNRSYVWLILFDRQLKKHCPGFHPSAPILPADSTRLLYSPEWLQAQQAFKQKSYLMVLTTK